LHDVEAGLLLGSDSPQILNVPGFSIHHELALLVEAGLTPAEALTTGTVNPGRFFGLENTLGRVAAGFDADLILLQQNPLVQLETLRHPLGVMVRGRWISADEINIGLALIAQRYAEQ
jgi:imidazolonepropionase-like amidohydrolase